jgi:RNA polymerase sigma-70 factor (ECF subfamily)
VKRSGQLDSELMKRVVRGDGSALAELYDLHAAQVFGLCLRILNEPQLAEDTLQEVFVRVWEKANTYAPGRGQFATWVMGITRNLCIDQLRRLRARPQAAETEGEASGALPLEEVLLDPEMDVPSAAAANERAGLVRRAIARLSPEQRLVIELSYFRGFTRREIARKLKLPEGTVHTRARLALQNLRQQLTTLGVSLDDLS